MEQNEPHGKPTDHIDQQEGGSAGAGLPVLLEQLQPLEGVEEHRAAAQSAETTASVLSAIERLKLTVDEETEQLEGRQAVDFAAFSQRKNRGLLELTRAVRLTQGVETDPHVVAQLGQLRDTLSKNRATLQMHLDAVREVSTIIARSIQEHESDGTYSSNGAGRCK